MRLRRLVFAVLVALAPSLAFAQNPGMRDLKCAATSNTANIYACNLPVTTSPSAYVDGTTFKIKIDVANTGSSTVQFNTLGAVAMQKFVGGALQNLVSGDLQAGEWIEAKYETTCGCFQVITFPSAATAGLSSSGVTAGTYGSSTLTVGTAPTVPFETINSYGQVTAAGNLTLGQAATEPIGTSGAVLCLLNAAKCQYTGYIQVPSAVLASNSIAAAATLAIGQQLVTANASTAAFTVTYDSSPTLGECHTVTKTDSSANVVTVSAGGSTINGTGAWGATTYPLSAQGNSGSSCYQYLASGSGWVIYAKN